MTMRATEKALQKLYAGRDYLIAKAKGQNPDQSSLKALGVTDDMDDERTDVVTLRTIVEDLFRSELKDARKA